MELDSPTFVIDNGSYSSKIGFAGVEEPQKIFPTVANDVNPVQGGIICDWDKIEVIWDHILTKEINNNLNELCILLSEIPLNPKKKSRKKTTEIMFEKFNIGGFCMSIQGVLAFYSSGRNSGINIDCDDGITYIVPIFEGYGLCHAAQSFELSGHNITDLLSTALQNAGHSINKKDVINIKEKLAFISCNEVEEASVSYKLPDGRMINIGEERFQIPEILFKPSIIGIESNPINEKTLNSLFVCDVDIKKIMHYNIVTSGGTSLLPGFTTRMQREISVLAPVPIKVTSAGLIATWIGGSILGSLIIFKDMIISQQEYKEQGSIITNRKCFI